MAFTSVLVEKKQVEGGDVIERYTWDGSGVTTGNITADTTEQPEMIRIDTWSVSSNGDTAVIVARDAGATVAKLTFSSGDSGTLTIRGKAA